MRELAGRELLALAEAGPAEGGLPLLLLDVREPWEFERAAIHVDGLVTRSMPMRQVPGRLAELDPLQPVACICHHGMRSAQVVAFLASRGFAAVYNLAGGIDAWSEEVDAAVPRY